MTFSTLNNYEVLREHRRPGLRSLPKCTSKKTLACSKKRKASGMSADAPDDISGPSNSPTEGNKDGKILDFWAIDRMLGGRPPRDPPEYLSRGTNDLGLFWAPCPSGTLNYEQRKIDNEGGVARPVKTDYSLLNSDSLVPYEKSKPMKKKQKPEDQTPDGEDRALDEELLHMEKPDRGDKHATFKWYIARAASLPEANPLYYSILDVVNQLKTGPDRHVADFNFEHPGGPFHGEAHDQHVHP